MASLDVRDVLNLPQDGQGAGRGSGGNGVGDRRPSKKGKKASSAGLMGSAAAAAGGSRQNLKGLAREVQSLGGSNPIAIVPQMTSNFKKKRAISRKPAAHWELRAFRNSARDDGSLVLRHWRRRTEAPPSSSVDQAGSAEAEQKQNQQQQQNKQEGEGSGDAASGGETTATAEEPIEDSAFAKFNVQVVVPQYNDDQYNANLQSTDWTREETDYLMQLVKDFDLRWPIIWDRYDYPSAGAADAATTAPAAEAAGSATGEHVASTALVRASGGAGAGSSAMSLCTSASASRTVEDLKARYYEIAAKMMAVQKPAQYMTQAEYNLHGMMANFKPLQEKMRKTFVSNALKRSREEVREEEALLLEVRRIMARVERTNEERRELYSRLDFPHAENDISTFKTSSGLHALLQSLMFNNEKSKKRKSLAAPDGNSPVPGSAGGAGSSLAGAAASASAAASAAGGGAAEAGGENINGD